MNQEIKMAAVMVIYEDTIADTPTFKSMLSKLPPENVLIYDNSKTPQTKPYSFHYIHNPENPGVSKAYNYAAEWAITEGFSHLLLLDSDTKFPENAVEVYGDMAGRHPDHLILPHIIAEGQSISPFWFKWGKSWYGNDIPAGAIEFQQKAAINSGMLIPLKQYERTQGYDEQIPLDWSDISFCRQLGRFNIKGIKAELDVHHDLSESSSSNLQSAKFRFKTYMIGVKRTVAKHAFERILMLTWAKLKAFKLSLKYKSIWFILHYSRKLINV